MGEAKRRGNYEERKTQAIIINRLKFDKVIEKYVVPKAIPITAQLSVEVINFCYEKKSYQNR